MKEIKWTYETCYEEAKKYTKYVDFAMQSSGAYDKAMNMGWIKEYTWLERKFLWTRENAYQEAKKYKTRSELHTYNEGLYTAAYRHKWLDDYTWMPKPVRWTKESALEIAKKYSTKKEFKMYDNGAYKYLYKIGELFNCNWLSDDRFDKYLDKVDSVYVYEFIEQHAAYVGRTLIRLQNERDVFHRTMPKETTYKYILEHNIELPEMKILETDLTIKEGAERECYWINKYKEEGWNLINKAKGGSLGTLGKNKWTYDTTYEEAKKYNSRKKFSLGSSGAYNAAWVNGWLDDYNWFNKPWKTKK